MSVPLRFHELTDRQRAEARARFLDAGTIHDDYWYELTSDGHVLCRTRIKKEPAR